MQKILRNACNIVLFTGETWGASAKVSGVPWHLDCLQQSPNDWFSVVRPKLPVRAWGAASAKVFRIRSKKDGLYCKGLTQT